MLGIMSNLHVHAASDNPVANLLSFQCIWHSIALFNQHIKSIMKRVLHYCLNDFYFICATEHLFSIFIVNSNFIIILSLWSNHVYNNDLNWHWLSNIKMVLYPGDWNNMFQVAVDSVFWIIRHINHRSCTWHH